MPERSPRDLTRLFADGIGNHLRDPQTPAVLRPYQRSVFGDLEAHLRQGNTKASLVLPTGSGKTVLFVVFSKALMSAVSPGEARPKMLVVEPTKDLVYQTIGQSGKRGFGRFAPQLRVGSYFSDTPTLERRDEFLDTLDVVVTTYQSLKILSEAWELKPIRIFEEDVLRSHLFAEMVRRRGYEEALYWANSFRKTFPTGRPVLDKFDVIVFDEAHHIFGPKTKEIVESLPEDKIMIGLTATPDASEVKKLTDFLPEVHRLELNEAIWLGLLAPVMALGVRSGIQIRGSNLYNEVGDFIDSKISYLAHERGRNRIILDCAEILSGAKIGTLISCLAGDKSFHARYLAEQLVKEGVSAAAVHEGISTSERKVLYERFEAGEIDVLTFVKILGEGWDSQRAKAIIGARPTRSLIFSTQRLGRITRLGGIALAIDICDEYQEENPAITFADVLNEGNIELGRIIGIAEDDASVKRILELLKLKVPVMSVLPSPYKTQQLKLSGYEVLTRGVLFGDDPRRTPEHAIPSRISSAYSGVTEEILEKAAAIMGIKLNKKIARQGQSLQNVYRVKEAQDLLYSLPKVDPNMYFTDQDGIKRISVSGLVTLFGKRYPRVSEEIIERQLQKVERLDWIPVRVETSPERSVYRHFAVTKMYPAGKGTIDPLNQVLSEYFKTSSS